ncbi:MAG: CPBP family intramembrane glutamic endopeptidase [bacterium]
MSKTSSISDKLNLMGLWSAFSIVLVLFVLTLIGGVSYAQLLSNILSFVLGNLSAVPRGASENLTSAVLNTVAVILITLLGAIVSGLIFSKGSKSYDADLLDKLLDKGSLKIFLLILGEEMFARGLILGVGTMLLKGEVAFYVLFLLGNAIWALIHLSNFSDKSERKVLRVIPQFVGGVAFTYIFVRYGLGAAIMAHWIYDVILFAMRKEKLPSFANLFTIGYYALLGTVLFLLSNGQGVNLSDATPWLNGHIVPLEAYGLIQYAILLTLIDSLISVVVGFFLLDSYDVTDLTVKMQSNLFVFFAQALLAAGMIVTSNWVLSFVVSEPQVRALITAIGLGLIIPTTSGSMLARATLTSLPGTFLTVIAFTVLGFWSAVGLSMIFILVDLLPTYVRNKFP